MNRSTENELLKAEVARLKKILQENGISYENDARRRGHDDVSMEHLKLFHSYFKGRNDVYSKRGGYPDKKTGRIGYYAQIDYSSGEKRYRPLTGRVLLEHLKGEKVDCSDVVGLYPLLEDGTCNLLVFDFDNHNETTDNAIWPEASAIRQTCRENKIPNLVEKSRSGKGAHIWFFFEEPIPASLAREFGSAILAKSAEHSSFKDFKTYDRMIPAQDYLPINRKTGKPGVGSMVALPLQGQALKIGNSAFVDEKWRPYDDQWKALASTKKISTSFVEEIIQSWGTIEVAKQPTDEANRPWEKPNQFFNREDVDGEVEMVVKNLLYINTANLKPRIQNQLRRVAAFSNPEFYKKQAMGFSTSGTPRIIFCGYDDGGYICLPRGLLEEITQELRSASIKYHVNDKRNCGQKIKVSFDGELYPEQKIAAAKMLKYDHGILNASPAFGKTVVGAYLISEHKVSTLVLVHNTEIMKVWLDDLSKFLVFDEEIPPYTTPTGRKKTRTNPIGQYASLKNTATGLVDVAMVGSLGKPGNVKEIIKHYGMVIMDECHHGSARIADGVLSEVDAKIFYGLTATPKRNDGMEKKIYMRIGPIRHRFSATDYLRKVKREHLVAPRLTDYQSDDQSRPIQEVYAGLIDDADRNKQIVNDVVKCVGQGRTPIIITKFKKHAEQLHDMVSECVGNAFLLTGGIRNCERDQVRDAISMVGDKEPLAIIATGQYIGEGFNLPRLDTLFLAVPIAWAGSVEQYVGRLHRDYTGKSEVIVYDYVDSKVQVLQRMYRKRLRAYKKIGYKILPPSEPTQFPSRGV